MAKSDKFSEMNQILEACAKEVQEKIDAYEARQSKLHADKSPAQFAHLGPQQIKAFAAEAIQDRLGAVKEAAIASIVASAKVAVAS